MDHKVWRKIYDKLPSAKRKSEAELVRQLGAPSWQFWIGFAGRAAAAQALGEEAEGRMEVLSALVSAARHDPDINVRVTAAEAVGFLAHRGRLEGADVGELVDALIAWLGDRAYAEHHTMILRSIGLLGKGARRAEAAVRAYLQPKIQALTVGPIEMTWSSFALARTGDDPAGPVQAIGVVLKGAGSMTTAPVLYAIDLLGDLARPLLPELQALRKQANRSDQERIDKIVSRLSQEPEATASQA